MSDKRIFVQKIFPDCRFRITDTTEYHDGYVDLNEYCGLHKKRVKCNYEKCDKRILPGMTDQEFKERIAKALCRVLREKDKTNFCKSECFKCDIKRVCRKLQEMFPNGVWFMDMAEEVYKDLIGDDDE